MWCWEHSSEAAPALPLLHRGSIPVLLGQVVVAAAGTAPAAPHRAPRATVQEGCAQGHRDCAGQEGCQGLDGGFPGIAGLFWCLSTDTLPSAALHSPWGLCPPQRVGMCCEQRMWVGRGCTEWARVL